MKIIWFIFFLLAFGGAQSPLAAALALILSSLSIGALAWGVLSKWMTLTFILIYLGGMMVVFLYVTSLLPNNKLFFTAPSYAYSLAMVAGVFASINLLSVLNSQFLVKEVFFLTGKMGIAAFVMYLLMVLFFAIKGAQSFKGALMIKF